MHGALHSVLLWEHQKEKGHVHASRLCGVKRAIPVLSSLDYISLFSAVQWYGSGLLLLLLHDDVVVAACIANMGRMTTL
jgi:hypothetical protein